MMKKIIALIVKLLFCFALCGGLYLLLETAWKIWSGTRTDISMFYLAGFMSIPALLLNNIYSYETDFLLQCGICTVIATACEGMTGLVVNQGHEIWDYTSLPLTFFHGQCNLFFCAAWFLLFAVFIPVLDYIEWKVFGYKEEVVPYYKVFGKKRFDWETIISLLKK